MTAFKFACPVCGQHISCEAEKAGSQMECPTCYQKLVVPQAPKDTDSKFILTASKVQDRPVPTVPGSETQRLPRNRFPFAAVALIVALCAIVATAFVYRARIQKLLKQELVTREKPATRTVKSTPAAPRQSSSDTNWTLNLTGVAIPSTPVAGRINGSKFTCERAVLNGGRLDLRQGLKWPPDLGLSIYLDAVSAQQLADFTINILPDQKPAPNVRLRWKDERSEPQTKWIRDGYALHLVFGQVAGERISGKIYLCMPDESQSWVAGSFDAEIREK